MRIPSSCLVALAFAWTLLANPAHAGGLKDRSAIEAQLGVRLAATLSSDARIGSTFEGVVLDPAKLSARGFAGIQENDTVLLKVVGPNNEFEVQQPGSPVKKRFTLTTKGSILPVNSPATRGPMPAPPVKK